MNHGVEDFAVKAYAGPDSFPGGLKRMPQIIRRGSNVLFVVLEGINQHWLESKQPIAKTSKYIDGIHADIQQNWDPELTAMPNLVKLAQDGMWYKKAYATGDRTDKGLASIFTAWPSQPWQGLMFQPSKWTLISQQKLPAKFHEAGYSTSFLYGGDPDFANMGSFLKFIGFQQVVTPNQNSVSDWGTPDQEMVPKLIQHLKSVKKPFFTAWLTLSSHEPYDVVTEKGLTQAQQLRKSIEYTDQAIGKLVAGLKAANLYDSTVIVFVSDHGKTVGLPVTEDYEQEFFRIPLIITGGPMRDMYRGVAPYLVVSQTDIYATLAEQLLENVPNVPFSRNMYFANHPGMALSFTDGKAVLAAAGYRHHLFLDHFNQKTASDSIVLGLQSKIIRTFFSK
jgi:phosphoglycerol transferase MdoB-like AlkP superfamily enzyme